MRPRARASQALNVHAPLCFAHMQSFQSTLSWRCEPISDLGAHAADWNRLAALQPTAPFLHLDFIEPALSCFGSGGERLAVGRGAGGRTAALAILGPAGIGRMNTFQPSQLPVGPLLLEPGIDVATAARSLTQAMSPLTPVVGLTQLDEAMYPRPTGDGLLVVGDYITTAWVDVSGSFDAYWAARGKNLRQNIRKQRRKLEEDGIAATLDELRSEEDMATAVADYGRLESVGWKGADGSAVSADNVQGRFYRDMLQRFCRRGRGCVYRYRFNGEVVAVDLCIESDDTLVILKTTYDERVNKALSPAFLMREEAFARIWQQGRIRRIEFFGRLMDWHKRWTDNARGLYHLTHFRWRWLRSLRGRGKTPGAHEAQPVHLE